MLWDAKQGIRSMVISKKGGKGSKEEGFFWLPTGGFLLAPFSFFLLLLFLFFVFFFVVFGLFSALEIQLKKPCRARRCDKSRQYFRRRSRHTQPCSGTKPMSLKPTNPHGTSASPASMSVAAFDDSAGMEAATFCTW